VNPQETFIEILIAAMKDAALEGALTQLATQIDPDGKGLRHVRIIVVPEQMQYALPGKTPFGSVGQG
jgi:hypothetical protein